MLYAPPASFKSFIALDLALSVAHGVSWRGQVVKPASVLYIAAEGKSGIYARVIAWAQHRGATGLAQPFRVCPSAVNFLDAAEVARFATCLQELDQPPTYVVVDTLARCSLGADENSATDAGRIMAAATHIAEAVNGHVMLVHHSGKDAAKGARGSSAFRGAVDTELRLERDDRRVWIRVDKHKDAEEPKPACFDMVAIEGLHPKTGEILSSLVPVADSGHPASPPADKSRYGRNETAILAFLATTNEATFTLIRDHLNIEKGNLGRALRRLEHAGAIVKSDDARPFYRLPEMEGADD